MKEKKRGIYNSRGFHKASDKSGIPLLMKSSKSPKIKYVYAKNIAVCHVHKKN